MRNPTIPDQDIAWFLQFFEERVAAGERFQSGQSLQVGWMYTLFEEAGEGLLRVMEPDMNVIPLRHIDSVDRMLMDMRNQRDVVQSLARHVEPDFPSLQQSAVVHIDYKAATRVLLTWRSQQRLAGWRFAHQRRRAPRSAVSCGLDHVGFQSARVFS